MSHNTILEFFFFFFFFFIFCIEWVIIVLSKAYQEKMNQVMRAKVRQDSGVISVMMKISTGCKGVLMMSEFENILQET